MQSVDQHARYYCPRGSHAPIKTREGFYVSYAGDPQVEESQDGGYRGDIATIAISFNVTTSSQPSASRRAALKANIANKLLKIDETNLDRFGVVALDTEGDGFGWAVRFEATHSVSSVGYGTASEWKDAIKETLIAKPFLLNEDSSSDSLLVNIAVDIDSVRGVVAGRRTMVCYQIHYR